MLKWVQNGKWGKSSGVEFVSVPVGAWNWFVGGELKLLMDC